MCPLVVTASVGSRIRDCPSTTARMKGIIAFLLLSVLAVNAAVLTRQNGRSLPRHIQGNDKQLIVPTFENEGYVVAYFMYSFLRRHVESPYQLDEIRGNPDAVYIIFAGKWTKEFQDGIVSLLEQYPLTLLDNQALQSRGIISGISNLANALDTLLGLGSSTVGNTALAVQTVVQTFFDTALAAGDLAVDAVADQLLKFLRPFKLVLGKVYDHVVNAVNTILGRPAQIEI